MSLVLWHRKEKLEPAFLLVSDWIITPTFLVKNFAPLQYDYNESAIVSQSSPVYWSAYLTRILFIWWEIIHLSLLDSKCLEYSLFTDRSTFIKARLTLFCSQSNIDPIFKTDPKLYLFIQLRKLQHGHTQRCYLTLAIWNGATIAHEVFSPIFFEPLLHRAF